MTLLPARPFRPVLLAAALLSCLAADAAARWAGLAEAPATLLSKTVTYDVGEDGSFVETGEEEILIENEAGRQQFGTDRTVYNSRAGRFEVLAAETRIGGRVVPVPPGQIEDKPVSSNVPGFDELRRTTVAYPNVEKGVRVYQKYRRVKTEVPFPGHFSARFVVGNGLAFRNLEVLIRSRKPLFTSVNDPDRRLEVTHGVEDGRDTVRMTLKAPVYCNLADEVEGSFLHLDQVPYLSVSTHRDYVSMLGPMPAAVDDIIGRPLPEAFGDIPAAASKEKRPVDRLNAVTAAVADRVRYFGDWRPVNGGFVPRPLSAISESRFGDCKDLAVLTAAILRRMGMRADVAFVWRSSVPPARLALASDGAFNHAIVRATDNGATYWIDPTNRFSFAQGIPEDLAERDALVLDPAGPRLEQIPLPVPETSRAESDVGMRIEPTGSAEVAAKLSLTGNQAATLTGMGRYMSPQTLRYRIIDWVTGGRRVLSGTVSGFDADSTVVSDIALDIRARVENVGIRATAGMTYLDSMDSFYAYKKIDPSKDRGHLYIGFPSVNEVVSRLKDARLVGNLPGACRVESPWVDASWAMETDPTDVILRTRRVVKRQVLTPAELSSPAFSEFQRGVRECLGGFAVVFAPRDAAAAAR